MHYRNRVLFFSLGLSLFLLILGRFIVDDVDLLQNLLKPERLVASKNDKVDLVAEPPASEVPLKAAAAPSFVDYPRIHSQESTGLSGKENATGSSSEKNVAAGQAPAPGEESERENAVLKSPSAAKEDTSVQPKAMLKNKAKTGETEDLDSKSKCNIFSGKWVFDSKYPLYQSSTCPFMDSRFRCQENGRPDFNYTKLRWQPHACNLPRFDPGRMLQILRNKRILFSGDSIGRNQFESFVCMLYQGVQNKRKVYETRGRKFGSFGEYTVRFEDYNVVVEFYESHFLVMESGGQLILDRMSKMYNKWSRADILVVNSAHWWDKPEEIQSYKEHKKIIKSLDIMTAYSRAMDYWGSWIDSHIDPTKVRVFFRAVSPTHFRRGQWNEGGVCNLETEPMIEAVPLQSYLTEKMDVVQHLLSKMKTAVILLNITILTEYRKDGHISIWHPRSNDTGIRHIQDCSHWCLPGVPDTWNQLLFYALRGG